MRKNVSARFGSQLVAMPILGGIFRFPLHAMKSMLKIGGFMDCVASSERIS